MGEQLELFHEEEFPEQTPATEPVAPSAKIHSIPKTAAKEQPPEGYVFVRVGPDEELTELGSEHATRLGLPALADTLTVIWNRRMRTAAGRAFYQTGRIELNPKLQALPDDTREKEILHTFLHELAHLVSFARAGGKRIQPHGPEWRQACADLGIPNEDRCHDLNFQPRRQQRKFAYECPACGSVVKRVRRLKRKVACYDCCRAKSGGQFDSRYALIEKKLH